MRHLAICFVIILVIPPAALLFCNNANAQDSTDSISDDASNSLYCPNCNSRVEEGYIYCPNCGYKLPYMQKLPAKAIIYKRSFLQISPTIGTRSYGGDYIDNPLTYGVNMLTDFNYFTVDFYLNYASLNNNYYYNDDYSSDLYMGQLHARIPISINEYFAIGPSIGMQYDKYCSVSEAGYSTFSYIGVRGEFFARIKLDFSTQKILLLPSFYVRPTWTLSDDEYGYYDNNYSTYMGFGFLMRWRFCEYVGLLFSVDTGKSIHEHYPAPSNTLLLIGPTIYPF
jgi:hypothetical protein